MDIVISAAQGRGKTTLARALISMLDGHLYQTDVFGAHLNTDKLAREIVEASPDVVLFDGVDAGMVEPIKKAVQKAREHLKENIKAIYCVQTGASQWFENWDVRDPSVGVTELSVSGDMPRKQYTCDILVDMARTVLSKGLPQDIEDVNAISKHFGVSGVALIPPVFYATAHAMLLPIYQKVNVR